MARVYVAMAQHVDLSVSKLGHGVGQSWRGVYITNYNVSQTKRRTSATTGNSSQSLSTDCKHFTKGRGEMLC